MEWSNSSFFRARDEYNNMSDEEMDKDAYVSMLALDLADINRCAEEMPIKSVVEHLMKMLGGSENVADISGIENGEKEPFI